MYEDPAQVKRDTWKAMVELYQKGLIKPIGVSNFLPLHLEHLKDFPVQAMVDQIEFNPAVQ